MESNVEILRRDLARAGFAMVRRFGSWTLQPVPFWENGRVVRRTSIRPDLLERFRALRPQLVQEVERDRVICSTFFEKDEEEENEL